MAHWTDTYTTNIQDYTRIETQNGVFYVENIYLGNNSVEVAKEHMIPEDVFFKSVLIYRFGFSKKNYITVETAEKLNVSIPNKDQRYYYVEASGYIGDVEVDNIIAYVSEDELERHLLKDGVCQYKEDLINQINEIKEKLDDPDISEKEDPDILREELKTLQKEVDTFICGEQIKKQVEIYTYHDAFVKYRDYFNHNISEEEAVEKIRDGKWQELNDILCQQ